MKYLKKFETETAYNIFKTSLDYITPNVSLTSDDNVVHYNPYYHDYSQDYLTMTITTGGNITWKGKSGNTLSYSTDNGATWSNISSSITLPVNTGDKVLWKGRTTPGKSYPNYGIGTFGGDTNVRYSVEGNAMSLLFNDDFKGQTSLKGKDYAFNQLFYNNKSITSAENLSLPATTLANSCYLEMFNICRGLTTAPELPATTLAENCYNSMFYGCTNLTTAPSVLPATTLANYCYKDMFRSTSLITAPELPATTLATYCCYCMFYGCTHLTTAPELPATTLAENCYDSMFQNCTNLTATPELLATTLVNGCYKRMFRDCTSLNSIKCLATDISATECTTNWVNNVATSGTFTKAASMTSWTRDANGIPEGWTVQDAA